MRLLTLPYAFINQGKVASVVARSGDRAIAATSQIVIVLTNSAGRTGTRAIADVNQVVAVPANAVVRSGDRSIATAEQIAITASAFARSGDRALLNVTETAITNTSARSGSRIATEVNEAELIQTSTIARNGNSAIATVEEATGGSLEAYIAANLSAPPGRHSAIATAATTAATAQSTTGEAIIDALAAGSWWSFAASDTGESFGSSVSSVSAWATGVTSTALTSNFGTEPTQATEGLDFDGSNDFLGNVTGINLSSYVVISVTAPNINITSSSIEGVWGFRPSSGTSTRFGGFYGGTSSADRYYSLLNRLTGSSNDDLSYSAGDFTAGTVNVMSHLWTTRHAVRVNQTQAAEDTSLIREASHDTSSWQLFLGGFPDTSGDATSYGDVTHMALFIGSSESDMPLVEEFFNQYY